MTISNTARKAGPFPGNGVTTAFAFAFKVFQASDLLVVLTDASGNDATQTLSSQYTVALNANQDANPGGTVTMLTPPDSTHTLTIGSQIPYTQPMVLTNTGGFYPTVLNDSADREVALIQQLLEAQNRTLKVSISTPAGVSTSLPSPASNKVISWNNAGTALENRDITDFATAVAFTNWQVDTFTGDGATTLFVLTANPVAIGNTDVSIAGVTQVPNIDYTLSGNSLTFTAAPPNGVRILARYGRAGMQTVNMLATEYYTATAGQVLFNLSTSYIMGAGALAVYLNGARLTPGEDYTETSTTALTLTVGATLGDRLLVVIGNVVNNATLGASAVGYAPVGAGAVARDVQSKLREFVTVTDYSGLQAAYNSLPATGGVVYVPPGYTETLAANLTMNKPFSGFLFMGSATITMGTYQIVMSDGCPGQFIDVLGGVSSSDYFGQVQSGVFFRYTGSAQAIQVGQGTLQTGSTQDNHRLLRGFALNIESAGTGTIGIQLNNQLRANLVGLNIKASGGGASSMIGVQLKAVGTGYVGWVNLRDVFSQGGMVGVDTVGQVNLCTWRGGGCSTTPAAGTSWGIRRGTNGGSGFYASDIEIAGAARAVQIANGTAFDRYEVYGETNTYDVYFDTGATNCYYQNTAAGTAPVVSDGNGASSTNVAVGAGSDGAPGDFYLAGNSNALYGKTSSANYRKLLGFTGASVQQYGDIVGDILTHQFLGASGVLGQLDASGMKVKGGLGVNNATPAAQSTGWGTPTGASKLSNFPGATATLVQTSGALAQLIADLKATGILGA